jgi:hypothetical protein
VFPVEFARLAGWSALIAAGATIVGMVTLLLFFSRGGAWGRLNDASSVVLMLALIPVALAVGEIEREQFTSWTLASTAIGVVAMVAAAVPQALLAGGRLSYERVKLPTLVAGTGVGLWYLLTAFFAIGSEIPEPLRWSMAAAGVCFIAVSYGFIAWDERHPLSVVGGVVLFVASLAFLGWIGVSLVTGSLTIPVWNG